MLRSLALLLGFSAFAASPLNAQTSLQNRAVPVYKAFSEDVSEQRRSVFVRIDQRLDEADLLAIATQVQTQGKRVYPRTQVNFALPGMSASQGFWASVLFAPDPKVSIHGLSRADEDLFIAEHKADHRSLLGSWLTSTPAPLGRLTIYSDHGKVFAEWRLRGGQKTVDELTDTTTKTVRRFDVPDGGYFILTRSGELEIRDKASLIATAERIRPEQLARPVALASALRSRPQVIQQPMVADQQRLPSSPTQPESRTAAPVAAVSAASAHILPPTATAPTQLVDVTPLATPVEGAVATKPEQRKTKLRGPTIAKPTATAAKPKARNGQMTASNKSRGPTTGDEISAKLAGRF